MPRSPERNYFVVRHDLESLQVLPGFIWNSYNSKWDRPVGFRTVKEGDRWISFAYTTSDAHEKAVSLVTGFHECVREYRHGKLPPKALAIAQGKKRAWMIEGKDLGAPLSDPVVVPPLRTFLGDKLFHQRTITRVSREQFERIRTYTREHRFSPERIPCLRREPRNEQEVLAIIASAPEQFGIQKIVRAQTRFPDMLVRLKRRVEEVHLELELYSSSFLNHGHERQVRARRFKGDGKSIGVLCWIDDDQGNEVGRHVHDIYALRDLLREKRPIRW